MIRIVRFGIGALGVGLGLYGALLLRDLGGANFIEATKWLVGGVILHDGLIGPAVILIGALAVRVFHGPVPGPVIVGGVVLGSVTLAAVPMIGRFAALEDNPTLLPRNYAVGWLAFAGLISVAVTVALVAGRRSSNGGEDGTGTGRR